MHRPRKQQIEPPIPWFRGGRYTSAVAGGAFPPAPASALAGSTKRQGSLDSLDDAHAAPEVSLTKQHISPIVEDGWSSLNRMCSPIVDDEKTPLLGSGRRSRPRRIYTIPYALLFFVCVSSSFIPLILLDAFSKITSVNPVPS